MELLFGHQKTPKGARHLFHQLLMPTEIIREHQRTIRKSMRDVERERVALQNQEKKITMEIKRMAKQGQLVRRLVRVGVVTHFFLGRSSYHGEGPRTHQKPSPKVLSATLATTGSES